MKWEVDLVREYQLATGKYEYSTPDVASWAITNGKYKHDPAALVTSLASKLSKALRNEHFTDPQGRSVRLNHPVTNREGQTKMPLWYDIRSAPPDVMQRALQQRRQQIVADNHQMKVDCDSYNENYNTGNPIQLVFDYTRDLEEIEAIRNEENKKSA